MTTHGSAPSADGRRLAQRLASLAGALCLAVMACAVMLNVVLRYGFGTGVAASEELSRLLFVWMVFIGAAAAYPAGEHMAFTSLVRLVRQRPVALAVLTRLVHAMVLLAAGLLAWGAWQQVVVGFGARSPVMGYPMALLPLPALLCSVVIGVLAARNLLRGHALDLGHEADVE